MSRIGSAALTLVLVACPVEQKPEIGAEDAGLTAISHPVTSTKTATTTAIDPKQNIIEPPPEGECPTAPKWVSQPPCVRDGFLYASDEFRSESNVFLARGTAANRARRRLALATGAHENDKVTLTGTEIDQIYICGSRIHALARMKYKPDGELKTCSADSIVPAPAAKGCAKWIGRMAWQEGETLYGVAPTIRVMTKVMGDQTAVNRARQAVAEMVEIELQLTPDGLNSAAKSTPLREMRRSTANCQGTRWMLVAFQKGGADVRGPTLRTPVEKMELEKKGL